MKKGQEYIDAGARPGAAGEVYHEAAKAYEKYQQRKAQKSRDQKQDL